MNELKPCPFCGGEVVVNEKHDIKGEKFYPTCANKKCLGRNTAKYYYTRNAAIKAWNIRNLRESEGK